MGDGGGLNASVNAIINLSNSLVSGNASSGSGHEIYVRTLNGSINLSGPNLLGRIADISGDAFSGFTPTAPHIIATSDGNKPTALNYILAPRVLEGFTYSHPLVAGSPAIAKASTAKCPPKDQRGKIREEAFFVPIIAKDKKIAVVDLGGDCDIGATEFSPGDP